MIDRKFAEPRCALTPNDPMTGHISPLFWQHREPPARLREEMQAMRSVGIRQCIVESRPHPDWLGPGWWESLDAILDEAGRLGMRVWVFDDSTYPSGRAGTLMRDRHPELMKVYLARREIEARGPIEGASFRVGAWVGEGESLVGVVAGRRSDPRGNALVPGSLVDLSHRVVGGHLRWDVPEGSWRLYVLVRTRSGGEEWTRDYLNPLLPAAGKAFVQEVHEAHYARYGAMFGGTFAGFFTDEPRFGNKPVYDAILGKVDMVLPWCDDLLAELSEGWNGGFRAALPALWLDAGELSHRARFRFMDVVSRRFGKGFSDVIGDWCRAHGVQLIGHVVEDNEAHARLGHGAGHFFRAVHGQDMSGLDIVYSAWPGFPEGVLSTPFGPWDIDFFRWGIGKMASSAAHADPRKAGRTMCEIFGAFGWQLGLRDMKWLTDHACARGINFLVPHAFSPKFPDPDCPPHFYAGGHNPQWRLFGHWSSYAERLCHLLSGGEHRAPVAVLYHAEAEWAGDCELFRVPVQALAERQIDCDVLSIDSLLDPVLTSIGAGSFTVNRESFRCLVVPYAQRLPVRLLEFLPRLVRAGVRVAFTVGAPSGVSDGSLPAAALSALLAHPMTMVLPTSELADVLDRSGLRDIHAQPEQPHLRTYHYRRGDMDLVFCFNEDPRQSVDTTLSFDDARSPVGYDALNDALIPVPWERAGRTVTVHVILEPYGSRFVVFPDGQAPLTTAAAPLSSVDLETKGSVAGPWRLSIAEAADALSFAAHGGPVPAGDLSLVPGLESFGGTAAYEADAVIAQSGETWLDLGEVGESSEAWLDGTPLGIRICPPHRYALASPAPGRHALRIQVTTTLARRLGDNAFDRVMPHMPIGLVGPVRLLGRRRDSR